jgi:ribosomal protein S18 acetylase RimI-like enzyme
MAEFVVRRAGREDAEIVARIHLSAWRETYDTLIPPQAAEPSVEERAARWRASFADASREEAVFLVSRASEAPAGFVACGPVDSQRLAAAGFLGEIYAIYILRRLQRQGAGRMLMRAAARRLLARGLVSAGVWVLRDNLDARRFYESLGAKETGIEGVWPVVGLALPDLAYGWRDLTPLAAHQ